MMAVAILVDAENVLQVAGEGQEGGARIFPLELIPLTPEGPFRHPQNRRRFMPAQLPHRRAFVNPLELHQSQSLFLFRPLHRSLPYEDLLNPDRSHVTHNILVSNRGAVNHSLK